MAKRNNHLPYEVRRRGNLDLVTTAEACELLGGINRATITRLVKAGRLTPAARVAYGHHGAFLFRRSDVDALSKAPDAPTARPRGQTT